MREAVSLANASVSREPVPNRSPRRRLAAWLFLAAWTALVIIALYFLLRPSGHGGGGGPVLVQQNDSKTFLERSRDWFRLAHVNFSRIYPWIFFAPYVAWIGWRFSLERGRWRVSLPAHLAAGTAFVLAAHAVNSRVSNTTARVVIINSEHQSVSGPARGEMHSIQVAVSRDMGPAFHGEYSSAFSTGVVVRPSSNGAVALPVDPLANTAFTNLITELKQAVGAPVGPPALFTFRPLSTLLDICAYAALVGLAHAIHFYQRYRERERCALMLESNLAKARLGALQAQLQPHFLFNTLNAIATLLRRDPRAAETTVLSLSELLRLTLSRSDRQETSMREEIHFAERYFAIQQTRFGERLQLEVDVEPEAMDCLVPTLLLQPLVENAIHHGIEPSDDAGHIWLKAHRHEQTLVLTVEDDGVGLGPTLNRNLNLNPDAAIETAEITPAITNNHHNQHGGVGLTNLRARLEALYGATQKLELSPRPGGGIIVRVEIPWHCSSRNTAQLQANR